MGEAADPHRALVTSAPIETFYRFYGID